MGLYCVLPLRSATQRPLLGFSGPQSPAPYWWREARTLSGALGTGGPGEAPGSAAARGRHGGGAGGHPSPFALCLLRLADVTLGGGAGGPLRHYWLRAAPPSPAAGQHFRAGKGAGFKFENPGDGGGVERGTGPSAQAPGEGART